MSYVDRTQTLVVGQSHGGWTTLAYGAAKPDPSVKGEASKSRGPANLEDSLNRRRKRLKLLICSVKLILVVCADVANYQANWQTWVDRCEQTQ